MASFSPIKLPRNPDECAPWLYEALSRLNRAASSSSQGMSAILRGEAPDGSGSGLVDTSKFFYKPGLAGGQVACGGTGSLDSLVLSSTASTTKGLIYLGSARLSGYDEATDRIGLGTVTPAGKLHITSSMTLMRLETAAFTVADCTISGTTLTTSGSFLPIGGPAVRPGMLITGTGIPAGTYVQTIASGTSLTMTQAGTAGTITASFQTFVDIRQKSDETGRDVEWLSHGAVRFTPGTGGVPFSIVGDRSAMAAGLTVSDHIYLEAGYVSSGSGIGTDLQIGGPNRGELAHFNLYTYTAWLTRSPASGSNICVGVGSENPATYNGGYGPTACILLGADNRPATIIGGSSGTGTLLQILPTSSGTSPSRTLNTVNYIFLFRQDGRFYLGNAAGGGVYQVGTNDGWSLKQASNDLYHLETGRVAAWSDSLALANSFFLHVGDANGGHRALFVSSSGHGVLTRFGISSQYTLLSNGQAGGSNFPAPDGGGSPTTLRIYDAVTGGFDGSVVCKIETARTGKTADLLQVISAVSGAATCVVDSKAFLQVSIKSSSFFVDATDLTKKLALDLSRITTGITRTLTIPDTNGTVALTGLAGTKVYYVADSSGGSPTRKLTFQDGILISEV